MALYIPHSVFHLARLLYVRPENFGTYYVHMCNIKLQINQSLLFELFVASREQVHGAISVEAG